MNVTLDRRHRIFTIPDAMRMNFALFEQKGDNKDTDRLLETQAYSVESQYESYWTDAKLGNYCSIMPVFDTNDAPINPNRFTEKLVDAMCEVTFTLKHYAIGGHRKADGKEVEATDVFSAQVETIVILKKPPVLAPSPYKGRLTKRPHHKPQLPTRGEQVNAAAAFLPPQPDFSAMTTSKSTITSLQVDTRTQTAVGNQSTTSETLPNTLLDATTSDGIVLGTHTHTKTDLANVASTTLVALNALIEEPVAEVRTSVVRNRTASIKPQASTSTIGTLTSDNDEDGSDYVEIDSPKKRKLQK